MIPISQALNPEDREHLTKILGASGAVGSTQLRESVEEFLRNFTYVDESSLAPFRDLDQQVRERLISALVWRISCFIDGSVTSVKGVRAHDIGAGFLAVQARDGKREVFCLKMI